MQFDYSVTQKNGKLFLGQRVVKMHLLGKSLVWEEKIVGTATIVADSRVGSSSKIVVRISLHIKI